MVFFLLWSLETSKVICFHPIHTFKSVILVAFCRRFISCIQFLLKGFHSIVPYIFYNFNSVKGDPTRVILHLVKLWRFDLSSQFVHNELSVTISYSVKLFIIIFLCPILHFFYCCYFYSYWLNKWSHCCYWDSTI